MSTGYQYTEEQVDKALDAFSNGEYASLAAEKARLESIQKAEERQAEKAQKEAEKEAKRQLLAERRADIDRIELSQIV
jgi:hypothetical protein